MVGTLYVCAAVHQKNHLNLSAAAGGQYPYLVCAKRMAEEGITNYLGDRNRMPLYPALLSVVYHENWDTFVERSAWFAIVFSVVILAGIACVAYRFLAVWSATALTLLALLFIFIPKSSFVQAELLYYGLLLVLWLLCCRLLVKPSAGWAILAGVLFGLTYLTKASALPALAVFAFVAVAFAIVSGMRQRQGEPGNTGGGEVFQPGRWLRTAVLAVVGFAVVTYPYLSDNRARFGRYFYNVNATFFMWCDSWGEAKTFSDAFQIEEQYPSAAADQVPGPLNYWRTHTVGQMLRRLGYGFTILASLAWRGGALKYLVLAGLVCAVFGWRRFRRVRDLWSEYRAAVVFSVLLLGVYVLVYAWYAQVAYGARFVLSLVLPSLFAMLWLTDRLADAGGLRIRGIALRWRDLVGLILGLILVGEGSVLAITWPPERTEEFVLFYFNESHELHRAGHLGEAAKGFRGVVRLDPGFVPAHHGLGMIALSEGRFADAVVSLSEAVRLEPGVPDAHNSLGSALLQAGRTEEATRAYREAVRLDPGFATAWYNLGGAYCLAGRKEEARVVRERLAQLDAALARELDRLLSD